MLAIVFSMEKFNDHMSGWKTIVHTDHKPLESIVKKPLHRAPKTDCKEWLSVCRNMTWISDVSVGTEYFWRTLSPERIFLHLHKSNQKLSTWRTILAWDRRMSPFKPLRPLCSMAGLMTKVPCLLLSLCISRWETKCSFRMGLFSKERAL